MQQFEGTILDHYCIQRRLAKGGMSEVYLALDTKTNEQVAVKFVYGSGDDRERFRREVKTILTLEHKHILPALDYGEHTSCCYVVFPYIAYGTLRTRLRSGPLTIEEAGNILEQLTDALQFAHDQGIIHRDIKPANVLLHEGNHVYLADFGLVKGEADEYSITKSGYLIGTPEYMAPELTEGRATKVSDVYAVGVLLYEMLTGRMPFKAETPVAMIWKHLQEAPTALSDINPAIPWSIEQVVLRALAKNPQDRFQSAAALFQAYQQALVQKDDVPVPVTVKKLPVTVTVGAVHPTEWARPSYKPFVSVVGVGLVSITLLLSPFLFEAGHVGQHTILGDAQVAAKAVSTPARPSHAPIHPALSRGGAHQGSIKAAPTKGAGAKVLPQSSSSSNSKNGNGSGSSNGNQGGGNQGGGNGNGNGDQGNGNGDQGNGNGNGNGDQGNGNGDQGNGNGNGDQGNGNGHGHGGGKGHGDRLLKKVSHKLKKVNLGEV